MNLTLEDLEDLYLNPSFLGSKSEESDINQWD